MWAFLISPLGRKIALGVAGALVLAGLFYGAYTRGQAAGYQSGQATQLNQDKQQFDQVLSEYKKQLTDGQARETQALALLAQAQTALDAANGRIATLKTQQAQGQAQVASLPDAALFADITHKLAIRPPNDLLPNFYPAELRNIDSTITDYPLLQAKYSALEDAQAATDKKVDALGQRLDAVVSERDAAMRFGNQVVGYYTKAYNAAQKHHSLFVKILTLGIMHDKHIDLPDPVTLEHK